MSADEQVPVQPAPARLVAGRYRLGARRGSSIDAALFEAVDEELQRPVVVKLVHPDTSARPEVQADFRTAMEIAGGIHHPNIATAHSWGVTDWNGQKVLFVVSEQLTGGSVRDMLDRGRTLSPSQALLVGLDACKALDQLHRRGLFHGDIRPSTLVFGDDRRLRVVDPGLSQVLTIADDGAHRSNDLAKYASPEQAMGERPTAKSDVYMLCLTLFETLTGGVPFVGDSTVATLANRVDKLLPVSADLGALAAVLERAGRPDPDQRFSAAEFGRALVQVADRLPRPAPLPILANSLFGIDPSSTGDQTDPTGVLRRPLPAAVAPPPPPAPPVAPPVAPPELPATEPLPLTVTPTAESTAAVASTAVPAGAADDFDPRDEFPEHPPAPGRTRKWLVLLLVLLAVAGGALAWYNSQPEMRTVPELAGMEEGVALNAIAGDFEGVLAQESSEDVPANHVIRTDPATGAELEKGSLVTLFVSTGPAPRVLPDLVGLTQADATDQLEDLDLVVDLAEPQFDESVPEGSVISWSVPDSPTLEAGGTVTKGTAVRLVVSSGPAPREVPALAGLTVAEAAAALDAVQLTLTNTAAPVFSDTVPEGQVVSQDPAPGTSVARDSAVSVVVSKGRPPVRVPKIPDGYTLAQIERAMARIGLGVAGTEGDTTQAFVGYELDGEPLAIGTRVPYGTKVTLVFAPTPATTTTTISP